MLQRVSIQNFKSLKDVTLDLQKVNLLIGPNNSGKTNFLKALEFIFEFANKRVEVTRDLHFRKNSVSNHIFIHLLSDSFPFPEYEKYEHIVFWREAKGEYFLVFQNNQSETLTEHEYVNYNLATSDDIFFSIGYQIIYKPDSVTLTEPYPLIPNNEVIFGDVSNLIAFLDTIRDKHPDIFYSIQQDLSVCIPEFSQIRFDNIEVNDETKQRFGDKTFKKFGLFNKKISQTFWSEELSEGTLYFLALLCILHQPNPPKILLLEEPERGIHPRRIHEVMNFIFRLAEEKSVQIILTTHSEHVLNYFSNRPESVFVFDKNEEGATEVRNLKKNIIEPSHQRSRENGLPEIDYTSELGDNWMYGILGGVPEDVL